MKKQIELRPHHAEGVQRNMLMPGKNESHKKMSDLLHEALKDNPNAELVFTREFDDFCKKHCIEDGKKPQCITDYGSPNLGVHMDEEVAREHGWEFGKPYKISNILKELETEASGRQAFYIVAKITRDQYEKWLSDVRASKKRMVK